MTLRRWTAAAAALSAASAAWTFGGEDPAFGNPWHHEVMTKEAGAQAGWRGASLDELAWHADWIDSYLYNPVFWAQGGLDRLKASMIAKDELIKLHFDDLSSTAMVQAAFEQYAGGTLIGLDWAARNNDPRAARCIAGISVHALQDFMSHSNWVDSPDLRSKTWLTTPPLERLAANLYTGTYETPARTGAAAHGKYSLGASLFNQPGVRPLMDSACHAASPMSSSAVCEAFRGARGAVSLEVEIGVKWPKGVVYLNPAGIALDNGWLAEVAVRERGLLNHPDARTRMTAEQAFAAARGRAVEQTYAWLVLLDRAMVRMGHTAFWSEVKSKGGGRGSKTGQFEDIGQLAYQFVTAGTYPNRRFGAAENFLRVRLKTSNKTLSGTDSDIYAIVDGEKILLDYIPNKNVLFRYNDFEQGDEDVYLLGPFRAMPREITLKNDSASVGDVLKAIGRSFVDSLSRGVQGVRKAWAAITGKDADFVAENRRVWTAEELRAIRTETAFSLELDGRSEGHHRVHGTIRPVGTPSDASHTFFVQLNELECVDESKWDRGSRQDEIFIMALGVAIGGDIKSAKTPVFGNVNDGSRKRITNVGFQLTVNRDHGTIALPVAAWESDSETAAARNKLLDEFSGAADKETKKDSESFNEAVARGVAADWRLERIQVFSFTKGPNLASGVVLSESPDAWIKGGASRTFRLNPAGLSVLRAQIRDVSQYSGPPIPESSSRAPISLPAAALLASRGSLGLNASQRPAEAFCHGHEH